MLQRSMIFVVLTLGCVAVTIAAPTIVTSARVWESPDSTRLVFELSGPVEHTLLTLDQPDRLVLDLKNAKRKANLTQLDLKNSPIKSVRAAPRNGNDYRIVLDLKGKVHPKSFLLPANEQYGNRLVLDLYTKAPGTQELVKPQVAQPTKPTEVTQINPNAKREIVVVIDPGHGGEDPGAIGPGKVREKDIVLAISKDLRDLINKQQGYKAYLTRETDYYIGLRKRSSVARERNADLLISVHADAFVRSQARGASVFALSENGASSETARWLAQKENSADLIGGDGGVRLDDKDEVLAGVLLDLSSTASLKASLGVGDHVLRSLGRLSHLHKNNVQQAGFVVLKSPDIPSILVETGFISNPEESRRLNTRQYQKQMAQAISTGVSRYFDNAPPPGTWVAWNKQQKQDVAARSYIVQKGDTLSVIAFRNAVSVDLLRQLNGLRSDRLSPGQALRLPSSG